ncbi:MAG: hypothetical protein KKC68_08160 [Candidatus Thermoplasmatota archaeon]|nr:hypothetical protein [Candidatus Thermoplasmatota archaeon]MBU1941732.1 hypothetical protein [Candidatus Thermoplasmatota archaeon]
MVCYAVPTIAAIVHGILRKNKTSWNGSMQHLWLNLLLAGGAIFGLVDHWWNGELFYIGDNIVLDLMLGVAITVSIFIVWGLMVIYTKSKAEKTKE